MWDIQFWDWYTHEFRPAASARRCRGSLGEPCDRSGRANAAHIRNITTPVAPSRGSFLTGETYVGKHGRSLRLLGLEPENDMALPRGIVVHAASYVSDAFARRQGRVGRSQGCFAVSDGDIGLVLDQLGSGRLLFAWK